MSEAVNVVLVNLPGPISVVRVIQQGPTGAPGAPGASGQAPQIVLSATVSGGLGVALDGNGMGYPASVDTLAEANAFAGIAAQGGNAGATISVISSGPISETGWNWTPGLPVFLADGGFITQAAPSTGVLLLVGYAVSATEIFVRPDVPIQIS